MRSHLWFTVLVAVAVARPVAAADPPRESGLDVVPSTAFGFVTIRVSDLNTVDALKPVREAIAQLEKAEVPLESLVGVPIGEIDRVTVFWPTLPQDESSAVPVLVVTTAKPFNEARVLKALKAARPGEGGGHGRRSAYSPLPGSKRIPTAPAPVGPGTPGPHPSGTVIFPPRVSDPFVPPAGAPGIGGPPPGLGPTPKGRLPDPKFDSRIGDEPKADLPPKSAPATPDATGPDLYLLEGRPFPAVFLLDDRTLVFLPAPESGGVGTYFALVGHLLRRKADGPLAEALADAGKHSITAAARIGQVETLFRDDFPRELVPFRSLLRAQVVAFSADLGAKATVTARLTFADAAQARRAEPVLKTLIQLGTDTLADLKKTLGKESEWAPVAAPLLELAVAALDKAEVRTDGVAVVGRVETEFAETVGKALAGFPQVIDAASSRTKTLNNLRQIGLAIHNYHDVNQCLPTDVLGPGGKPLWSWRVLLLPYLEHDNLYKQLDLTKPWEHPANAKLLEKMPDVFRVYGREPKEKGTTFLQMPTSPFPPNGPSPIHVPGRRLPLVAIPDGTSNTLMVVEAAESVPWAKPADLRFDPMKAPKVGAEDRKWFHALFADGAVRILRRDKLTDDQLRSLMTTNGGEVVTIED
jgi:hypothetical protein